VNSRILFLRVERSETSEAQRNEWSEVKREKIKFESPRS